MLNRRKKWKTGKVEALYLNRLNPININFNIFNPSGAPSDNYTNYTVLKHKASWKGGNDLIILISSLSPGKYLMTSWENYAEFLEKLGVPLLLR